MSKKLSKQTLKLHTIVKRDKQAAIAKCLEKGASVDAIDPATGLAALHICAKLDHNECAALLLEANADANVTGPDQRTPLHHAIVHDSLMTFKRLLEEPNVLVNARDKHGKSPLALSILYQREDFVRLLVNSDRIDFEQRDSAGQSPLHDACKVGYHRCINLLCGKGIDIDERNSNGNTPLHLASIGGFSGCVAVLLTRGANASLTNSSGETAASLAASMGHDPIVPLLRDSSDSLNGNERVQRRRSRSVGGLLQGMNLKGLAANGPAQRTGSIPNVPGLSLDFAKPSSTSLEVPLELPPPKPVTRVSLQGDLPPPPTHPLLSPRMCRNNEAIAVPAVLPPPKQVPGSSSLGSPRSGPPVPTRAPYVPDQSDTRVSSPAMEPRVRSKTVNVPSSRATVGSLPGPPAVALRPGVAAKIGRGRGRRGRGRGGTRQVPGMVQTSVSLSALISPRATGGSPRGGGHLPIGKPPAPSPRKHTGPSGLPPPPAVKLGQLPPPLSKSPVGSPPGGNSSLSSSGERPTPVALARRATVGGSGLTPPPQVARRKPAPPPRK